MVYWLQVNKPSSGKWLCHTGKNSAHGNPGTSLLFLIKHLYEVSLPTATINKQKWKVVAQKEFPNVFFTILHQSRSFIVNRVNHQYN
jgi:hypothetical protein